MQPDDGYNCLMLLGTLELHQTPHCYQFSGKILKKDDGAIGLKFKRSS
jgi:hypothetical protein